MQNYRKTKNLIKKWLTLLGLLLTPTAFAYSAGSDDDVITKVLGGLINVLQSTPARLIFIVAVIAIGYDLVFGEGKIPKRKAIAAIIGIGIVFSASYLARQLGLGS